MPLSQITPDQDAIVTEIEIDAPPDRVFRALIDPQQLIGWWGAGSRPAKVWEMDARAGGRWRFEIDDPTRTMVINGISEFRAGGEILEFDPPRSLSYTWVANWHAQPSRQTVVRWELSPHGKGTRVKVTHSGLAEDAGARKNYSGGWPGVVECLKDFVEKSRGES